MTGGGRGWCAVPVARGQWPAHFVGGFRGGGRGHRKMYYATGLPGWMRFGGCAPWPVVPVAVAPDEMAQLRAQADWLRARLEAITARIAELEQPAPPGQE